ncbi:hypothetical protein KY331_00725 [Candidatus Woesearchaeota archaeon]|nr:hypothetical protein [Candidatus Woesearchaeota archaeon]
MPEERPILLTELLTQEQPDAEKVFVELIDHVVKGYFIYSGVVTANFGKIPFSDDQLEKLSLALSAGIEKYKRIQKLVTEYEAVRSCITAERTRRNNPNSTNAMGYNHKS